MMMITIPIGAARTAGSTEQNPLNFTANLRHVIKRGIRKQNNNLK